MSIKLFSILILVTLITSACAGKRSSIVIAQQTKDTELNCKEILKEIEAAEEYKEKAEDNQELKATTFLAPFGYMYTLASASEAIEASEERIEHLEGIFELSGCNFKQFAVQPAINTNIPNWQAYNNAYPRPNNAPMQPVIMQAVQPVLVRRVPIAPRPAPVYAFPSYTPKFYNTIEP